MEINHHLISYSTVAIFYLLILALTEFNVTAVKIFNLKIPWPISNTTLSVGLQFQGVGHQYHPRLKSMCLDLSNSQFEAEEALLCRTESNNL